MINEFKSFQDKMNPLLDDWKFIDIKVIAILSDDRHWIFNAMRIVPDSAGPELSDNLNIPDVPNLFVIHERWKKEQLNELLESLSRGELAINNKIIEIKSFNGKEWLPVSPPSFQLTDRESTREKHKIDFASYNFTIWAGGSNRINQEKLKSIDASLRSSNHPWDGLLDLRENFIGLNPHYASQTGSGVVEFIAPLGMRLSPSSVLEGKKIMAIIEFTSGINSKEVGLSVIAHNKGNKIIRFRQPINISNKLQSCKTLINLKTAPSRVKLIATYRGIDVDSQEFYGNASAIGNPRTVVLEKMMGGVEGLKTFLDRENGQPWEGGIGLLFHLLGFSPAHYGITPNEVPDIVVFPGYGKWFLIIECTGASPDTRNKLSKLVFRKNIILEQLKNFKAYPVYITKMKRSMITESDTDIASKERIAIITEDEIPVLLRMVIEDTKPIDVRNYLENNIPFRSDIVP